MSWMIIPLNTRFQRSAKPHVTINPRNGTATFNVLAAALLGGDVEKIVLMVDPITHAIGIRPAQSYDPATYVRAVSKTNKSMNNRVINIAGALRALGYTRGGDPVKVEPTSEGGVLSMHMPKSKITPIPVAAAA